MLRQVFPCGLVQPAGAFRASADAVLLADFAALRAGDRFADLGTGCGIVACAMALACPECSGVGIEREAELVLAARENIARLDLGARLSCVAGDVGDAGLLLGLLSGLGRGDFDVVVANPPYRIAGRGRPAAQALRERALAGTADCLDIFLGRGRHCCDTMGVLPVCCRRSVWAMPWWLCVIAGWGRAGCFVCMASRGGRHGVFCWKPARTRRKISESMRPCTCPCLRKWVHRQSVL